MRDFKRDPEWKRLERRVRHDLLPKMKESATTMIIAPDTDTDFDLMFAIQIGASILLEKPLLVMKPRGRTVLPKLERIADRVIEMDPDNDAGMQEQIAAFFRDFGLQ